MARCVKCKMPKPENMSSMVRTHVKMPGMIPNPGGWGEADQPVGTDYSEAQASERPGLKKQLGCCDDLKENAPHREWHYLLGGVALMEEVCQCEGGRL